MTKTYSALLEAARTKDFPFIKYAFGQQQLSEAMAFFASKGIAKDQLCADNTGAIGTKEAFEERSKFYKDLDALIIASCKPDEIYAYEYINHECGYSGDDTEALNITRAYFKNYTPSEQIRQKCSDMCECF